MGPDYKKWTKSADFSVFDSGYIGPLASGSPNLGAPLSCGPSLSEILDTALSFSNINAPAR